MSVISYLSTSPDGLFWNSVESPWVSSICWSPRLHLFCAISTDWDTDPQTALAVIQTSPEGKTWTTSTQRIESPVDSICWSPELSKFCIMSPAADLSLLSEDGLSWTASNPITQTPAAGGTFIGCKICWSPELQLFCTTNQGMETQIMTSPDGLSWTPRHTGNTSCVSVCWSSDLHMFCVVTYSHEEVGPILTSTDGITWHTPTTPVAEFGLSLDLVRWSSGLRLFYVSGVLLAETGPNLILLTSEDGETWKYHPKYLPELTDLCWSPTLHTFCALVAS